MGFGWDLQHGKMIRVLPESGVLMIVAGEEQRLISQMRKLRWNGNAYTMGCWLNTKKDIKCAC